MINYRYIIILIILQLVFEACQQSPRNNVSANFNQLEHQRDSLVKLDEAQEAGGAARISQQVYTADGLDVQFTDEGVVLKLHSDTSEFRLNPEAVGLPASWKPFQYLEVVLQGPENQELRNEITLWCPRGRMIDTVLLQTGEPITHRLNLNDLPLIGSVREKYGVNQIAFRFMGAANDITVHLESLKLVESSQPKDLVVVDRFGQRKNTQWAGKMHAEEEFQTHLEKETGRLENYFDTERYDRYLGLKTGKNYQATGFFRIERIDFQNSPLYFLITPEGNPFWSIGVTGIRPHKPLHAVTLIKGNEQLYHELPTRDGPYAAAYIDSTFSFYHWNILRKYENLENWRDQVYQRLLSWGFNTIGNWAEKEVVRNSPIPFTWSFESEFRRWNKDVYHPQWAAYVDSILQEASEFRENPLLIGYFVDNESGWGHLDLLQTLPKNAYLRQEWLKHLQNKYSGLKSFNEAAPAQFSDWDQVMNSNDEAQFPVADVMLLEELYARQYFEVITSALKKYDPNHLYLGCRFTRKLKPLHLLKIAGDYCDVVTVNVYSYAPTVDEMSAWYEATGKPLLIGEHHAALASERQLPLRWRVFNSAERYTYYTNYLGTWARQPYSLGAHWYQFSDQDLTGRASNGENQIIGLVDITDQPHRELIRAAREMQGEVYELHIPFVEQDKTIN